MKDYINEATNIGLKIYKKFNDETVKEYTLLRNSNVVTIEYMNGSVEIKNLEEVDLNELDESQRQTLETLKKEIFSKTDKEIKFYGSFGAVYLSIAALQAAANDIVVGSVWFGYSSYSFFKAYRPYKLKKEMNLVSWIYDNKEEVNEVIKEEVREKINESGTEITSENDKNNMYEYPKDLVPYSKEMYTYGINLNNIDELTTKQLRKMKRKTIARQKANGIK